MIIELRYGDERAPRTLRVSCRSGTLSARFRRCRNRRIYLLVGDEFVVPGPRVVDATRSFAETLHPRTR